MTETNQGRALEGRANSRTSSRSSRVQNNLFNPDSDPHNIKPNADTLMEILQEQYPFAFKLIQEMDDSSIGEYGLTLSERRALELAIQKHAYPFTWTSKQHGSKEFSNIDQIGRYFAATYVTSKDNKTVPIERRKQYTDIPDEIWKF